MANADRMNIYFQINSYKYKQILYMCYSNYRDKNNCDLMDALHAKQI